MLLLTLVLAMVMNKTIQMNHDVFDQLRPGPWEEGNGNGTGDGDSNGNGNGNAPSQKVDKNKPLLSPACKPHFKIALSDGSWSNQTKFKRLYFYHARKAGVSNECWMCCNVLFVFNSIIVLLKSMLVLVYALGNELEELLYEGCCAPWASVRGD